MSSVLVWRSDRLSGADALDGLTGDAVVLAFTPTEVAVAARTGGVLRTADRDPWTLPRDCYQVLAFTPTVELRWLADGGSGRAAYRAEDEAALPGPATGRTDAVARLDTRALLWGRATGQVAGAFSEWADGRIGVAHYPCPPGTPPSGPAQDPADRAVLLGYEYVTVDAEHGTAAVADLRWHSLDLARAGGLAR